MRIATIFPGQGAQSVGMLSEAAQRSSIIEQRFAEASEVLSFRSLAIDPRRAC
jgi:[acyl-carrier-protein] S-malonyltransferase